jgi:hypothetical protein
MRAAHGDPGKNKMKTNSDRQASETAQRLQLCRIICFLHYPLVDGNVNPPQK